MGRGEINREVDAMEEQEKGLGLGSGYQQEFSRPLQRPPRSTRAPCALLFVQKDPSGAHGLQGPS